MNAISLTISDITIRQDEQGRYLLNDLHKAAGEESRHQPANWLRNQQTIDLIEFLKSEESIAGIPAIQSKQGLGTYVAKELVYAYAMWISAKFHLAVIRAYDALMTEGRPLPVQPATSFIIDHDPDRVVLMREIANQTKRLVRCRNPMERNTLARCVMHLNEMAGFADHLNPWVLAEITALPPLLDQDGEDAGLLDTFWANYQRLEHDEALNHMNKPGFIALNLAYVLKACQHKGMVMDISKDRLCEALRASSAPYPEFVKANFALGSTLMPKKIIKCWIFKAAVNGGVQ